MTPPDRAAAGATGAVPDFAVLFAALPIAAIVIDPDERVAHANMLAEELLNRSERAMRGRGVEEVLPPFAAGCRHEGEAFVTSDTRVPVACSATGVPGHPGWRTITLRPAAEPLGQAARGGRAATGAAAMLAHEVKNPLSGIRGAAQLIGRGDLPELIIREVDRIAALIDRMQAFGDERSLPLSAENIYPLLDHARRLALAGPARGILIEERFDPSLPLARINPDALLQVLINLLNNAAQALDGAGERRITLATGYRHGVAIRRASDGEAVALPIEIAVIDTGPGAPPDLAPHLFEPFVSGRRHGQGLGLALVDKLVRDMGGVVQYAREGRPATTVFRILLPREPA